jgi:predicted negative regulator of RcsB-dependent stress response
MTKTGEAARPSLALEPETLLDTASRYQKPIIIGAIILAASIGGLFLWKRSGEIKETRAGEALAAAETAFGAGNPQLAQPELEKIVQRYRGTNGGTQAQLLLAQIQFEAGEHDAGISGLETAMESSPEHLKAGVMAMIARGHEGAGRFEEAAAGFERAAGAASVVTVKDMNRMDAARNHAAAGNSAGAIEIYESIANREDSQFAGEAKVRLGEIMAKV